MSPARIRADTGELELAAGMPVTLERRSGGTSAPYRTRIDHFTDETIYIASPTSRLEMVAIPLESQVGVGLRVGWRSYAFESRVVEHVYHPHFLLGLAFPEAVTETEARAFYRLPTAVQPDEAAVVAADGRTARRVQGTIVNVSGGGLELVTADAVRPAARLSITFRLGEAWFRTLAEAIAVETPEPGRFNHRVHCAFVRLERPTQDRLVRGVFDAQRRLLERGWRDRISA